MVETQIVFDYREDALIEAFKTRSQCACLTVQNLEIGDVQILFQGQPVIIIERKTVSDLAQSIKDNRYKDQKLRQLAYRDANPCVKVAYIIEGAFSYSDNFRCQNMDSSILAGCIINSVFRDGLFTISTNDLTDTVNLIKGIFDRFSKDPVKYTKQSCAGKMIYNLSLASAVKTNKRENIDPQACFLMQLACIPGISSKKAQDIATTLQVTSMNNLIEVLRENHGIIFTVAGIGKKLGDTILSFCGLAPKKE